MIKETGGPAFPVERDTMCGGPVRNGMTLRDYFAAKAMMMVLKDIESEAEWLLKSDNFEEMVAVSAYVLADAMLAERNK